MKTLLFLPLLLAVCKAASVINATVYYDGPTPTLVTGVVDKAKGAAYGYYDPAQNETGVSVLNVAAGYATSMSYSDKQIMTAAGFLEGALSHQQMWDLFQNMYTDMLSNTSKQDLEKLKAFFQNQRDWMTEKIQSSSAESEFWYVVGLIYSQFEGLMMGYNSAAPASQKLDVFAFDFLNGMGDMLDLQNFLFTDKWPKTSSSTNDFLSMLLRNGHCSVLIKALPGFENIFASHSSWFVYSSMNRIYKHYAFRIRNATLPTTVMSFSSYAGLLSSWDDFYIMDSGLVMLQTTNDILNKTLYDYATSQALLAWHRVRVANWMAPGGKEWAEHLASYNSGTYNNQYMVLDLKRIHLKQSIDDNTLWVAEQIPGYVESADETAILRDGYWASYNVPFFEFIYNISGYPEAAKKHGPDVTHQLCPRAKIFRRDQGNVKDLSSMQFIMRYNDYKNDPYSEGSPLNAICSRGDLMQPPAGFGCIDTKVTDYSMALSMTSVVENGPTHQGLPPFDWQTSNLTDPHMGQPSRFNFSFVTMSPQVP